MIVYLAVKEVTLTDVETFAMRLRAFMMHSFQNQILFRSSMSAGNFRSVDDATNTVMGAAVSDAASRYDKANWIGVAATPRATMFIQSLLEREGKNLDHVLVDHHVPMKPPLPAVSVKAVNWPKAFYVRGLRPKLPGGARAMLLSYLAKHQVPLGTESKYSNTVAFFDTIREKQELGSERTTVKVMPGVSGQAPLLKVTHRVGDPGPKT